MEDARREQAGSCLLFSAVWWELQCCAVHICSFAGSEDPRSVKVGQVILQLHLDWGLDTDTQISCNKCKVDPSVNCWVRLWKLSKGVK